MDIFLSKLSSFNIFVKDCEEGAKMPSEPLERFTNATEL